MLAGLYQSIMLEIVLNIKEKTKGDFQKNNAEFTMDVTIAYRMEVFESKQ